MIIKELDLLNDDGPKARDLKALELLEDRRQVIEAFEPVSEAERQIRRFLLATLDLIEHRVTIFGVDAAWFS